MKNMTFIKIIILLVCICSFNKVSASTLNIGQVDTTKKIYDYANLITKDEEQELYNKITKIIDKYDIDVVITTVDEKTNDKMTASDFLIYFYDYFGFGIGDDDSGIILIIDMKNREFNISTIGSVQDIVSDYDIENILDKMEPDMKSGNYFEAATSFLKSVEKQYYNHKYGPPFLWISTIIAALILAYIMLTHEKKKLKLISNELEASNYLQNPQINYATDNLVDTKTVVIPHPKKYSSTSSGSSSGGRHNISGRKF